MKAAKMQINERPKNTCILYIDKYERLLPGFKTGAFMTLLQKQFNRTGYFKHMQSEVFFQIGFL